MSRIFSFLLFCAAALPVSASAAARANAVRTVIFISVDGLGWELLENSDAPEIHRLKKLGFSPVAETVDPPKTIPWHVSMLTGVHPAVHRNTVNEREEGIEKVQVPTLFDLLAANGMKTTAIFGKEKLKHVFDTGAIQDVKSRQWPLFGDFPSRFPQWVARQAVRALESGETPNLLFIHFAWVDTMGHWTHWGSGTQRTALREVDQAIGKIVASAHKSLPPYAFAVLITADHGGTGASHGRRDALTGRLANPENDVLVPFILYGVPEVNAGGNVSVVDAAPTAAHLLGLQVPESWKWQGRSVIR